ncbi:PQQ-dependent sugar dehydrogenase [soil metagenome]
MLAPGVPGSLVGGFLFVVPGSFTVPQQPHHRRSVKLLRISWPALVMVALLAGCARPVAQLDNSRVHPGGQIRLEQIGRFDQPIQVTSPPGDHRLFIVERGGAVKVSSGGTWLDQPFLDISGRVSTEQERGLFSIAFPPDYAESGRAYLSYSDPAGDNRIEEYRVDPADPNRLDPGSQRLILHIRQNSPIHNGGLIGFDSTGMLLIAVGDGGPDAPAQDMATLLGKFLRIDPAKPTDDLPYSVPADNPFVSAEGVRPEIWAFGLRNPWRWALDPATQDLYVADVGENDSEEINFVPSAEQPGANFGWPRFEGRVGFFLDQTIDTDNLVEPILTYKHSDSNCAVIGGGVYRGSVTLIRDLYLYGDFCDGTIKALRVSGGAAEQVQISRLSVPQLVSFGEDSDGEMYAVSLAGEVFRLTGAGS